MERDIHSELDEAFETHRIARQLHDIPPHEVYEVFVDGQRAVYKGDTGSTGSATTEGHVTMFVDECTSVPVPRILHVGGGYYVAAWHSDAPVPDGEHAPGETWAFGAGRGLALLHNETAGSFSKYGQFDTQNGELVVDGYDDWQGATLAYVRNHRLSADQHGYEETVDAVTGALETHSYLFEGIGSAVCCHGWATPEHVAVRNDRVVCMLDFEHALAAPGEFDYWRTITPTFTSDDTGLEEVFRDGYESVRPLSTGFERRKPLYSLLNLVYFFESLYVQSQHDPTEAAKRAEWFSERAREIIDDLS